MTRWGRTDSSFVAARKRVHVLSAGKIPRSPWMTNFFPDSAKESSVMGGGDRARAKGNRVFTKYRQFAKTHSARSSYTCQPSRDRWIWVLGKWRHYSAARTLSSALPRFPNFFAAAAAKRSIFFRVISFDTTIVAFVRAGHLRRFRVTP